MPVFLKDWKKRGFTLIELLVVIAIIAILIGLLLPAVQKVREAGNRASCSNNIKQLALAVHMYNDSYKSFPVNGTQQGSGQGYGAAAPNAWSWLSRILPYIEQQQIYDQCGVATGVPINTNPTVVSLPIKTFLCPADQAINGLPRTNAADLGSLPVGQTNYKGVCGDNWAWSSIAAWNFTPPGGSNNGLDAGNGIFYRTDGATSGGNRGGLVFGAIKDGTSNTFMIGEDIPTRNQWCSWPYMNNAVGTCAIPLNSVNPATNAPFAINDWPDIYSFRSNHSSGANFGFADGGVRYITNDIDLTLYRDLATYAGGEAVTPP
jgi:prepilin-type N-terminal cleavage/methylation domain-containing protein/prepilin-type processing-associated H-X9-DG protein